MIVLVVADPLDSLRHATPVVQGVEPPLDSVTMPLGPNCRVVEASKLMPSPVPDQEIAGPVLVKASAAGQDGGEPD